MIEPRECVRDLPAYRPGRPSGLADEALLNLAANENAWGPSPAVQAAWREMGDLARYPDMAGDYLKTRLQAVWRVRADQILLGTGSGHLIKCLAETYLRPGDTMVDVFPTFSLYAQGARLMGAGRAPLPGDGHAVDFAALPDWIRAHRPRLVFLGSPNNPTGDLVGEDVMRAILEAAGGDALVVVDEAYVDFAEAAPDLMRWVADRSNLALLRTFSKAYGLAGLRVGALVAHPTVVEAVGRVREPFPVSGPALVMGAAALEDDAYQRRVTTAVQAGRRRLTTALGQRGWRVNASQANFVWAVPPAPRDAAAVSAALRARGILIRHGESFGAADHLRITIGTPSEEDRLLGALDELGGDGGEP